MKKVTIGKYKGQSYSIVPYSYAEWQRCNGNYSFMKNWLLETKNTANYLIDGKIIGKEGKYLDRKLDDGTFLFYIQPTISYGKSEFFYFLVDDKGNFLRDIMTFRNIGAIDITKKEWITLCPNGNKQIGKMLKSPYYEHFPYETYLSK